MCWKPSLLAVAMIIAGANACDESTEETSATGPAAGGGGGIAQGGAGGAGAQGGMPVTNANCDPPSGAAGNLATVEVASGFTFPVDVVSAWGDSERLYVVEKQGRISVVKDGATTLFLDISARLQSGGANDERGLLGLAFHPDYVDNGRFFVHYSNGSGGPGASNGDTVIEEYRRDPANPDLADEAPVQLIVTTDQPYGNHNGGTIAFSPVDGFLWIGLGDGGDSYDTDMNGQDKTTPLAALLRLDVDSAQPYAAPAGNITDGLNLIHDWGLRNPYRWSFDICTGDRYIGDVGQGCFEEIDVAAASDGPQNWGWLDMEGLHCTDPGCGQTPPGDCDATGLTLPVVEIPRTMANSITGGHVYRGSAIPWLRGAYLYGDFAQGNMWWLRWENGSLIEGPTNITAQLPSIGTPSGFGLDNDGELYILDYGSGTLHRVVAE